VPDEYSLEEWGVATNTNVLNTKYYGERLQRINDLTGYGRYIELPADQAVGLASSGLSQDEIDETILFANGQIGLNRIVEQLKNTPDQLQAGEFAAFTPKQQEIIRSAGFEPHDPSRKRSGWHRFNPFEWDVPILPEEFMGVLKYPIRAVLGTVGIPVGYALSRVWAGVLSSSRFAQRLVRNLTYINQADEWDGALNPSLWREGWNESKNVDESYTKDALGQVRDLLGDEDAQRLKRFRNGGGTAVVEDYLKSGMTLEQANAAYQAFYLKLSNPDFEQANKIYDSGLNDMTAAGINIWNSTLPFLKVNRDHWHGKLIGGAAALAAEIALDPLTYSPAIFLKPFRIGKAAIRGAQSFHKDLNFWESATTAYRAKDKLDPNTIDDYVSKAFLEGKRGFKWWAKTKLNISMQARGQNRMIDRINQAFKVDDIRTAAKDRLRSENIGKGIKVSETELHRQVDELTGTVDELGLFARDYPAMSGAIQGMRTWHRAQKSRTVEIWTEGMLHGVDDTPVEVIKHADLTTPEGWWTFLKSDTTKDILFKGSLSKVVGDGVVPLPSTTLFREQFVKSKRWMARTFDPYNPIPADIRGAFSNIAKQVVIKSNEFALVKLKESILDGKSATTDRIKRLLIDEPEEFDALVAEVVVILDDKVVKRLNKQSGKPFDEIGDPRLAERQINVERVNALSKKHGLTDGDISHIRKSWDEIKRQVNVDLQATRKNADSEQVDELFNYYENHLNWKWDPEEGLFVPPRKNLPNAVRAAQNYWGKRHAYAGSIGADISLLQRAGYAAGSVAVGVTYYPAKFVQKLITYTPKAGYIDLEAEDAIKQFTALADMGVLGGMPRDVIESYISAFVSGDIGTRMAIQGDFLFDFLGRSGAIGVGGPEFERFLGRFVTKVNHKFGMVDDIEALKGIAPRKGVYTSAHEGAHFSSLNVIPNYREVAALSKYMAFYRKIGWGTPLPVIDKFFAKVWRPMVLMRLGYVARNGGEELASFIFREGPRKSAAMFLARRNAKVRNTFDMYGRKLPVHFDDTAEFSAAQAGLTNIQGVSLKRQAFEEEHRLSLWRPFNAMWKSFNDVIGAGDMAITMKSIRLSMDKPEWLLKTDIERHQIFDEIFKELHADRYYGVRGASRWLNEYLDSGAKKIGMWFHEIGPSQLKDAAYTKTLNLLMGKKHQDIRKIYSPNITTTSRRLHLQTTFMDQEMRNLLNAYDSYVDASSDISHLMRPGKGNVYKLPIDHQRTGLGVTTGDLTEQAVALSQLIEIISNSPEGYAALAAASNNINVDGSVGAELEEFLIKKLREILGPAKAAIIFGDGAVPVTQVVDASRQAAKTEATVKTPTIAGGEQRTVLGVQVESFDVDTGLSFEQVDEIIEAQPLMDPSRVEDISEQLTPKLLQENPNKIYLFGDNLEGKGKKGQAIIRDEPNAYGIPTKKKPSMDDDAFFTDDEFAENIKIIDKAFEKLPKDKVIVVPANPFEVTTLGTGSAQLQQRAPRTFEYLQNKIRELQKPSGWSSPKHYDSSVKARVFGESSYRVDRHGQAAPIPPQLQRIKEQVELATGYEFDIIFVQKYGPDSTLGVHKDLRLVDAEGNFVDEVVEGGSKVGEPVVASLSFGAGRKFEFIKGGKKVDSLSLGDGDLIVMHNGVQDTVQHQIAPVKNISMEFEYGKNAAPAAAKGLLVSNTFDAIKAGKRTATTRTAKQLEGVEVGDVIHFTKKGSNEPIAVRVTSKRSTKDIDTVEEWARPEGYDPLDPKSKKYADGDYVQIEFELQNTERINLTFRQSSERINREGLQPLRDGGTAAESLPAPVSTIPRNVPLGKDVEIDVSVPDQGRQVFSVADDGAEFDSEFMIHEVTDSSGQTFLVEFRSPLHAYLATVTGTYQTLPQAGKELARRLDMIHKKLEVGRAGEIAAFFRSNPKLKDWFDNYWRELFYIDPQHMDTFIKWSLGEKVSQEDLAKVVIRPKQYGRSTSPSQAEVEAHAEGHRLYERANIYRLKDGTADINSEKILEHFRNLPADDPDAEAYFEYLGIGGKFQATHKMDSPAKQVLPYETLEEWGPIPKDWNELTPQEAHEWSLRLGIHDKSILKEDLAYGHEDWFSAVKGMEKDGMRPDWADSASQPHYWVKPGDDGKWLGLEDLRSEFSNYVNIMKKLLRTKRTDDSGDIFWVIEETGEMVTPSNLSQAIPHIPLVHEARTMGQSIIANQDDVTEFFLEAEKIIKKIDQDGVPELINLNTGGLNPEIFPSSVGVKETINFIEYLINSNAPRMFRHFLLARVKKLTPEGTVSGYLRAAGKVGKSGESVPLYVKRLNPAAKDKTAEKAMKWVLHHRYRSSESYRAGLNSAGRITTRNQPAVHSDSFNDLLNQHRASVHSKQQSGESTEVIDRVVDPLNDAGVPDGSVTKIVFQDRKRGLALRSAVEEGTSPGMAEHDIDGIIRNVDSGELDGVIIVQQGSLTTATKLDDGLPAKTRAERSQEGGFDVEEDIRDEKLFEIQSEYVELERRGAFIGRDKDDPIKTVTQYSVPVEELARLHLSSRLYTKADLIAILEKHNLTFGSYTQKQKKAELVDQIVNNAMQERSGLNQKFLEDIVGKKRIRELQEAQIPKGKVLYNDWLQSKHAELHEGVPEDSWIPLRFPESKPDDPLVLDFETLVQQDGVHEAGSVYRRVDAEKRITIDGSTPQEEVVDFLLEKKNIGIIELGTHEPDMVQRVYKELLPAALKADKEANRINAAAAHTHGVKKIISGGQTGADLQGLKTGQELGLEIGGTGVPASKNLKNSVDAPRYGVKAIEENAKPIHPDITFVEEWHKTYSPRTERNVLESDGTIVIDLSSASFKTGGGSALTRNIVGYTHGINRAYLKNGKWVRGPKRLKKEYKDIGVEPKAGFFVHRHLPENPAVSGDGIIHIHIDDPNLKTILQKWLVDNKIETLNVAGNREKTKGIEEATRNIVRMLGDSKEIKVSKRDIVAAPVRNVHYTKGENTVLSNFHEHPEGLVVDGVTYKTAEGAYQAHKSGSYVDGFQDLTGAEAKKLAASKKIPTDTSANEALMRKILEAKLEQSPEFRQMLIDSSGFTHDVADEFWKEKFPELLLEMQRLARKSEDVVTPPPRKEVVASSESPPPPKTPAVPDPVSSYSEDDIYKVLHQLRAMIHNEIDGLNVPSFDFVRRELSQNHTSNQHRVGNSGVNQSILNNPENAVNRFGDEEIDPIEGFLQRFIAVDKNGKVVGQETRDIIKMLFFNPDLTPEVQMMLREWLLFSDRSYTPAGYLKTTERIQGAIVDTLASTPQGQMALHAQEASGGRSGMTGLTPPDEVLIYHPMVPAETIAFIQANLSPLGTYLPAQKQTFANNFKRILNEELKKIGRKPVGEEDNVMRLLRNNDPSMEGTFSDLSAIAPDQASNLVPLPLGSLDGELAYAIAKTFDRIIQPAPGKASGIGTRQVHEAHIRGFEQLRTIRARTGDPAVMPRKDIKVRRANMESGPVDPSVQEPTYYGQQFNEDGRLETYRADDLPDSRTRLMVTSPFSMNAGDVVPVANSTTGQPNLITYYGMEETFEGGATGRQLIVSDPKEVKRLEREGWALKTKQTRPELPLKSVAEQNALNVLDDFTKNLTNTASKVATGASETPSYNLGLVTEGLNAGSDAENARTAEVNAGRIYDRIGTGGDDYSRSWGAGVEEADRHPLNFYKPMQGVEGSLEKFRNQMLEYFFDGVAHPMIAAMSREPLFLYYVHEALELTRLDYLSTVGKRTPEEIQDLKNIFDVWAEDIGEGLLEVPVMSEMILIHSQKVGMNPEMEPLDNFLNFIMHKLDEVVQEKPGELPDILRSYLLGSVNENTGEVYKKGIVHLLDGPVGTRPNQQDMELKSFLEEIGNVALTIDQSDGGDVYAAVNKRAQDFAYWLRSEIKMHERHLEVAIQRGMKVTSQYIDDHRVRSQFQEMVGTAVPFWFAEDQFLRRMGRSLIKNPMMLRNVNWTLNAGIRGGIVQEDQFGEQRLVYPGSEYLTQGLLWAARETPIVNSIIGGDLATVTRGDRLSSTIKILPGYNFVGEGDLSVTDWNESLDEVGNFGFGPMLAVPLLFTAQRDPSIKTTFEKNLIGGRYNMNRGLLDVESAGAIAWSSIVPSVISKSINTILGTQTPGGQAARSKATIDVIAMMEMKGLLPTEAEIAKQPDPALFIEEFLAKVDGIAKQYQLLQTVTWFGGPSSFNFASLTSANEDWEMNQEFMDLVHTGLHWEEAMSMWIDRIIARDGDFDPHKYSIFQTGRTKKLGYGALVDTQESNEWLAYNNDFVRDFRYSSAFFIPKDFGPDEEEYSAEARSRTIAYGLRKNIDASEFLNNLYFNIGYGSYSRKRRDYLATRYTMKAANADTSLLDKEWQMWSRSFRMTHPVFDSHISGGNSRERRDQTLIEFRMLLNSPDVIPDFKYKQDVLDAMQTIVGLSNDLESLWGLDGSSVTDQRNAVKASYFEAFDKFAAGKPWLNELYYSVFLPILGDTWLAKYDAGLLSPTNMTSSLIGV